MIEPTVVVHGGAGPMKRVSGPEEERYRSEMLAAARAGHAALLKTGSALDAVTAAVKFMEDSAEFNAGAGACLDEEGRATLDASIMRGSDLAFGAVGAAQATKNAVVLARALLDEGRASLLVGEGADRRARKLELPALPPIDESRKKVLAKLLAERAKTGSEPEDRLAATSRTSERLARPEPPKAPSLPNLGVREDSSDTVGAIAVDAQGRVAGATSTGGLWLKAPFRVGDSAIPGGGVYASDQLGAAASATGIGERIMRVTLCKEACDRVGRGMNAQEAAQGAIQLLTDRFGGDNAGVIVIDRQGRIGIAFDTRGMGRAFARGTKSGVAVWREEKFEP